MGGREAIENDLSVLFRERSTSMEDKCQVPRHRWHRGIVSTTHIKGKATQGIQQLGLLYCPNVKAGQDWNKGLGYTKDETVC